MLRTTLTTASLLIASTANAYTNTNPLVFSVEADSDYPFCCSVNPGEFSVSVSYNDLFLRGMAEFNLLGNLGYRGEPVYLSFDFLGSTATSVFSSFGLPISINAYIGDNLAARPDYSVATFASLGSFVTTGRAVGSRITYDVTSIFQFATRAGAPALGFRFATFGGGFNPYQGASFGNFALTPTVPAIPEPSEYALLLAGLGAVGIAVRRKRAHKAA